MRTKVEKNRKKTNTKDKKKKRRREEMFQNKIIFCEVLFASDRKVLPFRFFLQRQMVKPKNST